jgi:cellulose synthase/poly-beta-1,6-N-acetylglucosamine synthase-like glycosyltransferase
VLLIVEADDDETRAAVARLATAPLFEIVVVPPGEPRTKPKALTYALAFARGDLVVVFDAEDRPEPDQLRKAAAAFRERPQLGCVQARLTPDNEGSWFARMFTLEYAANFDVLLPALADWGAPMPLGGTSNHFPRALLEKVAAWDPYNVTEDADLGIRLARFGYRSATIFSRTYEEAPVTFRQWLPQRRRWIKGWMQTVALSLGDRIPRGLRLPLVRQLAVHGILSAGVLGLLLYPVSLITVTWAVIAVANGRWPLEPELWPLLALNFGNLVAVLAAAVISALRGLGAAGARHLAWHIPFLPLYWALMSFAAWQALFQFFRRPSEWEKTAHGVARDRRKRRRTVLRS